MPLRDAGEYPFEIFLSYVRHALWLRKTIDWCKRLPEDLFVHDVLYYRINSEDISDCRSFFYEQLKDRIVGLDEYQAAVEINYWCVEHATYEMADDRTAGPMTMYRSGKRTLRRRIHLYGDGIAQCRACSTSGIHAALGALRR